MSREEYLKSQIRATGKNVKEFAHDIDIPYTTLLSMLKNLGGSSVDSVIKICSALGITIEHLNECGTPPKKKKPAPELYPGQAEKLLEVQELLQSLSSDNLKVMLKFAKSLNADLDE